MKKSSILPLFIFLILIGQTFIFGRINSIVYASKDEIQDNIYDSVESERLSEYLENITNSIEKIIS